MALSFPLALEDFFDGLPIASASFDLGEAYELSETGGGEIISASLGARLWKADINIRLGRYAEIEPVRAMIRALRQPGRSLLVHPIPLIAPLYDPDGRILGSASPNLANVASNNRDIRISNLPIGYRLQRGDKLSFQYGSNPVRYAFHEVITGGVVPSSGVLNDVEVTPNIRPGFALGAEITLIKPVMKMIFVPGSTNIGSSGAQVTDGVSFSMIQTLRA